MSEVKVSKITIEIEGKGIIELTIEEAQKMKACLDEIFKKPETIKESNPWKIDPIIWCSCDTSHELINFKIQ